MTNLDKTVAHIRDKSLDLRELADDVEQLIHERDEAVAARDRARETSAANADDLERVAAERDEARAEIDRLTCELDEERGRDDVMEAHRKLGETLAREGALRCELDRLRTTVPRVISPEELREGQVVAVRFGTHWAVLRVELTSDEPELSGDALWPPAKDADSIVLLSDPPADPEPEPWEPEVGDVGIVTHFRGVELDESITVHSMDGLSWWRTDGRSWPDGDRFAFPSEVTVVRAKVVPDE
ncbi:hypothetical protein [Nesterenkonia suensis]